MPDGFLPIVRTLVPKTLNKVGLRDAAVRNLCTDASESEIKDMEEFIKELKQQVSKCVDSLLTIIVKDKISEMKILGVDGKNITGFEGLVKLWKEKPTKALCGQAFEVLFAMWTPAVLNHIVVKTLLKLELWFSNTSADIPRNQSTKTEKLVDSFLKTLTRDKLRDVFRKKFRNPAHGISLTVTSKAPKEARKRQKAGRFNFDFNVRGWNGPLHKEFLELQAHPESAHGRKKSETKRKAPPGNSKKQGPSTKVQVQ